MQLYVFLPYGWLGYNTITTRSLVSQTHFSFICFVINKTKENEPNNNINS